MPVGGWLFDGRGGDAIGAGAVGGAIDVDDDDWSCGADERAASMRG